MPQRAPARTRFARAYGYGLAGLLGLFALAGMAGTLVAPFSRGNVALPDENRRMGALPAWPRSLAEWDGFPQRFEAFVNDRFGLREALIRTHTAIATTLLDRLPTDQVVAGRSDWLFYAGENSLALFQGAAELDPEQLNAWRTGLAKRAQALHDLGIGYAFTIAPDKHTIYGEYMPAYLCPGRNPSPYDQVVAVAQDLPVVDLRPDLIAAKSAGPLYLRDDTHWNARGAYTAYRTLMAHLGAQASARLVSLGDRDFDTHRRGPGDLARMALIDRHEQAPALAPAALPCTVQELERRLDAFDRPELIRTRCEGAPGKLLLYRDSFGNDLLPYLAASFGEVVAVLTMPSTQEILDKVATERPDLVLEERVERTLRFPPPATPAPPE